MRLLASLTLTLTQTLTLTLALALALTLSLTLLRYYSLFTLLMLVVFEATVVKSRMRNTEEMRAMANPASRCTVLRQGKWTALSSEALLPGDL